MIRIQQVSWNESDDNDNDDDDDDDSIEKGTKLELISENQLGPLNYLRKKEWTSKRSLFKWRFQSVENLLHTIRGISQIWVYVGTHHQCRISALVPQTSFRRETSGSLLRSRF